MLSVRVAKYAARRCLSLLVSTSACSLTTHRERYFISILHQPVRRGRTSSGFATKLDIRRRRRFVNIVFSTCPTKPQLRDFRLHLTAVQQQVSDLRLRESGKLASPRHRLLKGFRIERRHHSIRAASTTPAAPWCRWLKCTTTGSPVASPSLSHAHSRHCARRLHGSGRKREFLQTGGYSIASAARLPAMQGFAAAGAFLRLRRDGSIKGRCRRIPTPWLPKQTTPSDTSRTDQPKLRL